MALIPPRRVCTSPAPHRFADIHIIVYGQGILEVCAPSQCSTAMTKRCTLLALRWILVTELSFELPVTLVSPWPPAEALVDALTPALSAYRRVLVRLNEIQAAPPNEAKKNMPVSVEPFNFRPRALPSLLHQFVIERHCRQN